MQPKNNSRLPRAALSVDLEFFSDTPAFRKLNRQWPYEEDGQTGIERLLEIFQKHNVKSTFFVVARHAQSRKALLRQIMESGHEIASHGMTHASLKHSSAATIDSEVKGSKAMLEDELGIQIQGFRSPACQMNAHIAEAIATSGYRYDSSVVPGIPIPGWYGFANAPRRPFRLCELFRTKESDVLEFPLSTHPVSHTPVSGFLLRLLGARYAVSSVRAQLGRREIPVIYVHPWEFVSLHRMKGVPWRMYHRTGMPALRTVEQLLASVQAEFVPMRELITE